ncbi:hypothetical protein LCGC14_2360320 [marine sediment metagenome]|uniref:Uncharacterized protein n=1 Tax=marine sediment metagenome TaxID=412755 RepID=A0A0F9C704_9ZZZZ
MNEQALNALIGVWTQVENLSFVLADILAEMQEDRRERAEQSKQLISSLDDIKSQLYSQG